MRLLRFLRRQLNDLEIFCMQLFVIKEINKITKKYPKLKYRYQYDYGYDGNDTNIIEVSPENYLDLYEDICDYKVDLITRFYKKFSSGIFFITTDDLTKIEDKEVIYEKEGKEYK